MIIDKRIELYTKLNPIKQQYKELQFQYIEKSTPKLLRVYYKPIFIRSKYLICSIKIFDQHIKVKIKHEDIIPVSVIEQIAKTVGEVFGINKIEFHYKNTFKLTTMVKNEL